MSKKEIGTILKMGDSLYIPIPMAVAKDSLYSAVGMKKGDRVYIEIDGRTLRIKKVSPA